MDSQIPIPEGDGKVPLINTVTNQEEEAPEIKPFKISFDEKYYKDSECEVHGMSKENGSCALKIVRDIGVYFVDQSNFLSKTLRDLTIKYVANDHGYSVLYNGLEDDESIYEIVYKKGNKNIDLRIFFTLNDSERVFHVVAIRQTHYETRK